MDGRLVGIASKQPSLLRRSTYQRMVCSDSRPLFERVRFPRYLSYCYLDDVRFCLVFSIFLFVVVYTRQQTDRRGDSQARRIPLSMAKPLATRSRGRKDRYPRKIQSGTRLSEVPVAVKIPPNDITFFLIRKLSITISPSLNFRRKPTCGIKLEIAETSGPSACHHREFN